MSWVLSLSPKEEENPDWRFSRTHLERANTNEGPQAVHHTAERDESCQVKRQRTWDQSQPWSLSPVLLLWPVLSCTMRSWLHFCGSSFTIWVLCMQSMFLCGPNVCSSSFFMRWTMWFVHQLLCQGERAACEMSANVGSLSIFAIALLWKWKC